MRQSRGAYGTMAGAADGRGGGHARQNRYSTTAKSGVNSQKALFILMRVPIPISKVRYQKEATATYLSHCHRYRRRGRLATTEGEESRVRGAWKPIGKKSAAALHRRTIRQESSTADEQRSAAKPPRPVDSSLADVYRIERRITARHSNRRLPRIAIAKFRIALRQ